MGAIILTTTGAANSQAPPPKSWLDTARGATVALGTATRAKVTTDGVTTEREVFVAFGTGAIFGVGGKPLLITAKRNLHDPEARWDPDTVRLRFAWFEGRPVEDDLGVEVPLKKAGQRLWVGHPSADLAGLPLHVTKAAAGRDELQHIPTTTFAADDDIFEGAPIVVLGYPGAVGHAFWTRAVVRGGTVAWVDPTAPTLKPLLIDSQLFPGNSGGPVFRVPTGIDKSGDFRWPQGGKVTFLGIVSRGPTTRMPPAAESGRTRIEIDGPKGKEAVVAPQLTGLGLVEPAARVRELIELLRE